MSFTCPNGPGLSGWINLPAPDEIPCGCGIIYDCCGVIVPVGCMAGKCMLFKDGRCKIGPKISNIPPFPPEYWYLHEFLFHRDLDDNGKIYGFDFILENPPPCLADIPYVGDAEK